MDPDIRRKLDRTLGTWRDKLLAMDKRQPLLYFKHRKTGTLEFEYASALETWKKLGPTSLPIRAVQEGEPKAARTLYVSDKTNDGLRSALRRIDQTSAQAFADRGVWTLYIGVLMLHWSDPNDPQTVIDSPVLLVPVRLKRTGTDSTYFLSRTEEDVTINPVLGHKLAEEFGINLPTVDPDDVALAAFKSDMDRSIGGHPTWRVHDRMVLGNFTFHKEAMYQDLVENAEQIAGHGMVQMLALGPDAPSAEAFDFEPPSLEGLDERRPPETMHSILDSDASQRRCILSAVDGRSFVMDGPPGTGKSQTIANMIAELMAAGKTVLFVSEKAAALDVVRDRLAKQDLRHFLFELHSHAATRKEVAEELSKTLENRVKRVANFSEQDGRNLTRKRQELTAFASAMNEIDPELGWSIFAVLGQLGELDRGVKVSLEKHPRWSTLSRAELFDIREHAATMGRVWDAVVSGRRYQWRGLRSHDLGPAEARNYGRLAGTAANVAESLLAELEAVDSELRLDLGSNSSDIDARLALLGALEARPPGSPNWYNCTTLDGFENRLSQAQAAIATISTRVERLEEIGVSDWRDIDPGSLEPLRNGLLMPAIPCDATVRSLAGLSASIDQVGTYLGSIRRDTSELSELLGVGTTSLTPHRAAQISQLAKLAAVPNLPEPQWLNHAEIPRVAECIHVIETAVGHVNRHEKATRDVFRKEILELDIPALVVRFRDVHTGLKRFSGAARRDRDLVKSVSVTGRCDQTEIDRLEEAAGWQATFAELRRLEATYAMRLGPRYRGTETDFDVLRSALDNAREAMNLAGINSDPSSLARQLSIQGNSDLRILPLAERVQKTVNLMVAKIKSLSGPVAKFVGADSDIAFAIEELVAVRTGIDSVREVLHRIATVARRDLSVQDAAALVADVVDVLRLEQDHAGYRQSDIDSFGEHLSPVSDFGSYVAALENARLVQELYPKPVDEPTAKRLGNADLRPSGLSDLTTENSARLAEVISLFGDERAAELRAECGVSSHVQVDLMRALEDSAVKEIEALCTVHRELKWADSLGLTPTIRALERDPREAPDVIAAIEYVVLEAWVDARCADDLRLQNYKADAREDLVRAFKDLDQALINDTGAKVISLCNQRAPVSLASRAAQVIKREGEKKSRHKPVRTLLGESASIVQQLKPCFMMSPLSVSQYLPPSLRFDVVIFDEASQVLPSDAINCVYRAEQLIVAGDQKQLPPTDFFSRSAEEEDDDNDASDFESVLDLAKGAGGLRSLPLNWHYRSRHEDLIAYSNHRFYDGQLLTFPGAVFEAEDLGVSHIKVKGVYRRGSSADNPVEAAKVVERVAWFQENRPGLSLGVVTFSSTQADRILHEMESQSANNHILGSLLSDHDRLDGFFVKSLENVQGDERDVILFSIGYGFDETGKFTANFGPLNRDGGWRRLNVAITRARKRVEIISSFTASQMPNTSNQSLLHLRHYLDFAERGQKALALDVGAGEGGPESVFEEQVVAKVRSWGYGVVSQVGVAGYRIDMAITHPSRDGQYVLGIECDGAAYHSAQAARDRDRLRQQVLEGLGWRLHRIWGLSWWRDRSSQEDRLRRAIEDAINAADDPQEVANETTVSDQEEPTYEHVPDAAVREWTRPYVEYRSRPIQVVRRDPKTPGGVSDMSDFFLNVLRVEAPVHRDLLDERFRWAWGVRRIGSQIRKSVDEALKRAHPQGPDSHGFYRLDGVETPGIRVPEGDIGKRSATQVPHEELQIAMKRLVFEAVAIDETTLIKQTASLFGWHRQGGEIRDVLSAVVSELVHDGELEVDDLGDLGPRVGYA